MSLEDILSASFLTPILVAFIGFLVAVTSALITKEQKVSEFRQAWINDIRKDFATLLSLMNELSMDINLHSNKNINRNKNEAELLEDIMSIKSKNHEMRQLIYLIKLRLNPVKDKKIFHYFDDIRQLNALGLQIENNEQSMEHFNLVVEKINSLSHETHVILKSEWEIVKRGERKFLIFIGTGEFFVGLFIIAFFVLFVLAKFPEYFPGIN